MNLPQHLQVGERTFEIKYRKSLRLTSSVNIKEGVIHMTISRYLHGKRLADTMEKFLKWANKKLANAGEMVYRFEYKNGGQVVTHNKVYDLVIKNSADLLLNKTRVKLRENVIEVKLSANLRGSEREEKIRDLVEKTIIKDQTPYLEEVLSELDQLYFQEGFKACRFKRVSSRFGSCSRQRNINIAYRLLFTPKEVFRYVCVHELAHLREFNHSKRFWALVEQAMPNYKECEKWLKDNGFLLG